MKYQNLITKIIDLAFEEDIYTGDVTTGSIIPTDLLGTATMTAKADGVISGLEIVHLSFQRYQEDIQWKPFVEDGAHVKKGDVILEIKGYYPALLKAERIALNFFQHMSGIATITSKYVQELEGTKTKILDTRKTIPGLRALDKMAVTHGGGTNHRMGLYDMAMIKDNHIKMAGSIARAIAQVRAHVHQDIRVEVETTNLDEVRQAVEGGADIIMLDNMSNEMMAEAVQIIAGRAITEASGNMCIDRLKGVAATGVDFISVGALTHSVMAMDISMNIEINK